MATVTAQPLSICGPFAAIGWHGTPTSERLLLPHEIVPLMNASRFATIGVLLGKEEANGVFFSDSELCW